jgi:hypothetical protein
MKVSRRDNELPAGRLSASPAILPLSLWNSYNAARAALSNSYAFGDS